MSSFEQVALSDREECLRYLGMLGSKEKKEDSMFEGQRIINSNLLPHMGIEDVDIRKKAHFIAYMAKKLILAWLKDSPEDDRDHYGKKRVDMAGSLLLSLF